MKKIEPTFYCPSCKYPQGCGCMACKARLPDREAYLRSGEEGMQCVRCGHVAHFTLWLEPEEIGKILERDDRQLDLEEEIAKKKQGDR